MSNSVTLIEHPYQEKLHNMNLVLSSPFTKYKDKHDITCLVCGTTAYSSIQSRVQTFNKNGTNGCKICLDLAKYQNNRALFIKQINDKGYDILTPDYDGNQQSSTIINVKRIECGHVFDITPTNLVHRSVTCPICNK